MLNSLRLFPTIIESVLLLTFGVNLLFKSDIFRKSERGAERRPKRRTSGKQRDTMKKKGQDVRK
jgi:hypothetical protein